MKEFEITCNTSVDGTKGITIKAEKKEDITHKMIMDKLLEVLQPFDFEIGSCTTYCSEATIHSYEEGEEDMTIEGKYTYIEREKLKKLKLGIVELQRQVKFLKGEVFNNKKGK